MIQKSILQKILAVLARQTIRKYKPVIIGITGSVGKTSARLATYAVLKNKFSVRTAEKNYNNEIGLPLTILGIPHSGRNIFAWAYQLAIAARRLAVSLAYRRYPEVLILEYGVDCPGDMGYLLKIARPDIAVTTAIGEVPVHVEFFKSPEELIAEKAKLVAALPAHSPAGNAGGWAVLNSDDRAVSAMRAKTAARVITFGRDARADVKIANENSATSVSGLAFKIEYKGSVVPVRLTGAFGAPQAYAAASAAAVGLLLGMNLVEISEALADYAPPAGRMRIIEGIRGSQILDDTYNAAPEAMRAALQTLRDLPAARKIAVLGDMRELGRYTKDAHRAIGALAAQSADLIYCVGEYARYIADEAIARGADREKVVLFPDAASAAAALAPTIQKGDLVLVKGSQSTRMERIVETLMAHPEAAEDLLVRQEPYWKN